MVGSDSVCYVLHQYGLTCLRLCHDERALTFTDRGEEVYDTCAEIGRSGVATEIKFLVREEWGEVLKWNAVSHLLRFATIDHLYACQREVFLTFLWWAHFTVDHVASLQTITAHHVL